MSGVVDSGDTQLLEISGFAHAFPYLLEELAHLPEILPGFANQIGVTRSRRLPRAVLQRVPVLCAGVFAVGTSSEDRDAECVPVCRNIFEVLGEEFRSAG